MLTEELEHDEPFNLVKPLGMSDYEGAVAGNHLDSEDSSESQTDDHGQNSNFETPTGIVTPADTEISDSEQPFSDHCSEIEGDNDIPAQAISDTDSDSQSDCDEELAQQLATWAVQFSISHVSLSALLAILCVDHPYLPKDPRTLLGTSKNYIVEAIAGGSYYHFGVGDATLTKLKENPHCKFEGEISLQISIDGLPLFKSANDQFWPILGMLVNPCIKSPFIIGLFYGSNKPSSASDFLASFVSEMKHLQENGIEYNGKNIPVVLSAVICDAPARAFVKQIKSHSGYFGCDKCTQRGEWDGKIIFPETNASLRTDVQFDELLDEEHHLGRSPFEGLEIGMVSQFPTDYMHLVCLGVMRRLVWLWMKGPLQCRIGSRLIEAISNSLSSLPAFIPKEFARKPRSLKEVDRWKATEFRQLLLYTGPVVFLGHLHNSFYKNFLLLHVAISILVTPSLCQHYCDYAHELLCLFVTHFSELYGRNMLVYNVHGLVHLANEVKKFGPLDNISAFPYENFLQTIKKMIRKPKFPLQQVIRRLSEGIGTPAPFRKERSGLRKEHWEGPVPHGLHFLHQYKEVWIGNFTITTTQGNNCVKIGNNEVGLVRNILHDPQREGIKLVVEKFSGIRDFYTYPLASSKLGIFEVFNLTGHLEVFQSTEIQSKCLLIPLKLRFVAVSLH